MPYFRKINNNNYDIQFEILKKIQLFKKESAI